MSVPIENQEIPQSGLNEMRAAITIKEKITGLALNYNRSYRAMEASWNKIPGTGYYNFQFYTSQINPEKSMLKEGITDTCEANLKGLARGQRVYIRVRPIGNPGLGQWCEPVEERTP